MLSELLVYFEKDEARHVGLGVQYVPALLKKMNFREGLATLGFHLKLSFWEIASLKSMEKDLRAAGAEFEFARVWVIANKSLLFSSAGG